MACQLSSRRGKYSSTRRLWPTALPSLGCRVRLKILPQAVWLLVECSRVLYSTTALPLSFDPPHGTENMEMGSNSWRAGLIGRTKQRAILYCSFVTGEVQMATLLPWCFPRSEHAPPGIPRMGTGISVLVSLLERCRGPGYLSSSLDSVLLII